MLEVVALHTGNAHGADFLLVRQNADRGFCGIFDVKNGVQLGIGADPVVVAVGTQQASVQAHLPAPAGRHYRQFGRQEVFLDEAVLFVQPAHHVQLYEV